MAPGIDYSRASFAQIIRAAVDDLATRGYQSEAQVDYWAMLIREAARRTTTPDHEIESVLRKHFGREYEKVINRLNRIERFGLASIEPMLHARVERGIRTAADLIKVNKTARVEQTLSRFRGWCSSVPPGGSRATDKREVASHIAKPTQRQKFEARRVAIDQGHKLAANIEEVVAIHGGAIAGVWHDRGEHDSNYDARKAHLARSGKVFLVRDSWAIKQGLVRRGAATYMDEIERPAELPFCSCKYKYLSSIRDLPEDWLTEKGREAISH